ncbi:hypothetical protein B0H12DRAFT_1231143 [Mycena haematopus]|nr:hypothetical protein B0H12DRAFT_1231143 [Mycena haematopus]
MATSIKSKLLSYGLLAATFFVTLLVMWYIFHQMALAEPLVIYGRRRRKARQDKMLGVDLGSIVGMYDGVDIPLTAKPGSSVRRLRYDYEQQQKQRQAAEWVAQRRQYEAAQRKVPTPCSPRGDGHQQRDAQGRAVGYTLGPGLRGDANSVYSAYVAGALRRGEAEGRGRDEVGWDMGAQQTQTQTEMRQTNPPVQLRQQTLPGQAHIQPQGDPGTTTQAQLEVPPFAHLFEFPQANFAALVATIYLVDLVYAPKRLN